MTVLFVTIVEVGLLYSARVTSGTIRVGVLIFMGIYLVGITVIFFVILWKRPWILYPPLDFPGTSVRDYIDAMRGGQNTSRIVAENVSQVIDDWSKKLDAMDDGKRETIQRLTDELREGAIRSIENSVLHIDARPLLGKHAAQWEEPYDAEMPVEKLLRRVWFRLQPFPPYAYGTAWILRNVASGKVYDDIGPLRATTQASGKHDSRLLREIKLCGGMTLEIVRPAT